MTQEDKQLLLKDLCSRLPYGVECKLSDDLYGTICGIDIMPHGTFVKTYINRDTFEDKAIEDIKLYLRPMSSMTEEEKKERDFYCGYTPYDENIGERYLTEYDIPDYIDFLYEHHLDFHGLIPMGLALEAPEGMYKIEEL